MFRPLTFSAQLEGATLQGVNTLVAANREQSLRLADRVKQGRLPEGTRLTVESRCWEVARRLRGAV